MMHRIEYVELEDADGPYCLAQCTCASSSSQSAEYAGTARENISSLEAWATDHIEGE